MGVSILPGSRNHSAASELRALAVGLDSMANHLGQPNQSTAAIKAHVPIPAAAILIIEANKNAESFTRSGQ